MVTAVAFVVVLSAVLWKDPITKRKLLALLLTLVGCACVCGLFAGGLRVTAGGVLLGLAGLYLSRHQAMHIAVVIGSGLGCAMGSVSYPMLTEYACGKKDYATVYGVINAMNVLGGAVCPTLTNAIYDSTGSYDAALIMAAGLLLLAAVCHTMVKKIRRRAA